MCVSKDVFLVTVDVMSLCSNIPHEAGKEKKIGTGDLAKMAEVKTQSDDKLQKFIKELNSFDSNTNFAYEYSKERVSFLDLEVDIVESKLITNLFVKPTSRHQYLHYLLCHPEHTRPSNIQSNVKT